MSPQAQMPGFQGCRLRGVCGPWKNCSLEQSASPVMIGIGTAMAHQISSILSARQASFTR